MRGAVVCGHELEGDLTLDADVVVVGSGAGGAVVAAELQRAGQRVVVCEEGPHVSAAEHGRMRPSQSMRNLWRDGALSFAIGRRNTPVINVTMGRGVGGSSIVTGGVCFRTPEKVLDTWVREHGLSELSPQAMEPLFAAVEEAIHVETVPASMRSRATSLFGRGLAARGAELKPLMRNTRGCNGCGQCNFGCPCSAKMSVDLSYLPGALADGALIVSDCLIERVVVDNGRAVGVSGRLLSRRGGARRGRVRVHAKRVVVACGAWHGPVLLRNSGIGKRNRSLGRNLTLHPSFRMLARFDEPVRGWQGALQSAFSDHFMGEGITLVSLFVPPGVLAATMPGVGPEHVRRAARVGHMALFGGLIHDEGGGTIHRGPGREPIVTYQMAKRDRAKVPRALRLMAEIFFEAGARECFLPVLGMDGVSPDALRTLDLERVKARNLECTSQHPLGSCRMGVDPKRSVVDPDGQLWGVDGLYVADGSVVPTSLGVNPQLTVMAMALRIARKMLDRPLRR